MIKDIFLRIIATFIATALGVIGTASLIGIHTWQAALLAGAGAVANVIEVLARDYVKDGKITKAEEDAAFAGIQTGVLPDLTNVKADVALAESVVNTAIGIAPDSYTYKTN